IHLCRVVSDGGSTFAGLQHVDRHLYARCQATPGRRRAWMYEQRLAAAVGGTRKIGKAHDFRLDDLAADGDGRPFACRLQMCWGTARRCARTIEKDWLNGVHGSTLPLN